MNHSVKEPLGCILIRRNIVGPRHTVERIEEKSRGWGKERRKGRGKSQSCKKKVSIVTSKSRAQTNGSHGDTSMPEPYLFANPKLQSMRLVESISFSSSRSLSRFWSLSLSDEGNIPQAFVACIHDYA